MVNVADLFAEAFQHHLTHDYAAAERLYRQITQAEPTRADGWYYLGAACQAQGRPAEAETHFRQALKIQPDYTAALQNLSTALESQGKPLAPTPPVPPAVQEKATSHSDRGVQLLGMGKVAEAALEFQQAVKLWPGQAYFQNNLGNTCYMQGMYADAYGHFRKAIELNPELPEPKCNLGNLLLVKGHVNEAILCYRQALQLRPDYVEALCNLGNALRGQNKFDEAVTCFQRALAVRPHFPEALYSLGFLHQENGNMEEAVASLHKGLAIQPNKRFSALFATLLPPVYQSASEIQAWRSRLTDSVRQLQGDEFSLDLTHETAFPAFRLVYQGLNDRDLQRDIAQLFAAPHAAAPATAGQRGGQGKIKIGFISKHFMRHTIGRLNRGLMAHLSRDVFDVTLLSIGSYRDELAQLMQQEANQHVVVPSNLPAARRIIAEQALDVLFYTDIGMDPTTYTLAFSRLAPVQCVTWGHPVTTGIPTIDYFISCQHLETDESDQHYTEKLVRLKNLAVYYYRPELPAQAEAEGALWPAGRQHDLRLPADAIQAAS